MKIFVTGVNGQLGHDVMNELAKRNIDGIGSDLKPVYSGVADGSAVTVMPYVALDITDKESVHKVIDEIHPDAVIHCAAWTAVDMAEDDDKVELARKVNAGGTQNIAPSWGSEWSSRKRKGKTNIAPGRIVSRPGTFFLHKTPRSRCIIHDKGLYLSRNKLRQIGALMRHGYDVR